MFSHLPVVLSVGVGTKIVIMRKADDRRNVLIGFPTDYPKDPNRKCQKTPDDNTRILWDLNNVANEKQKRFDQYENDDNGWHIK